MAGFGLTFAIFKININFKGELNYYMKNKQVVPKRRRWSKTSLRTMQVGAISAALSALISPLVLVNQSQAPTVAYLTQRELLKTINQQDSQRVNTYGFWQNDPKLDLYYGQNANVADRALTDVNYHRFNY